MVARRRPQVAALVGCLLATMAQAATGATDLSHIQWGGGRQRCEQACSDRARPWTERWVPDTGPSVGCQHDPESGSQSPQAAHRLCYCTGTMGLVRAKVQGQLLEGKEALLGGPHPDREGCLGGRGTPDPVPPGSPQFGPWGWAAERQGFGSREGRGVSGVAVCQLGFGGRRCGCHAESDGLSSGDAGHHPTAAQLACADDPRNTCWTASVPAVSDSYLAAGRMPSVTPTSVAHGGPSDFVDPPGLSPQAPKHPGQRDKDAPRVPTSDAPLRENIKEATKNKATTPRQHVTLEAKLQARRQKEMEKTQALRPFGVGSVPTLSRALPSIEQTGLANLAKATLEDDDPDNARR